MSSKQWSNGLCGCFGDCTTCKRDQFASPKNLHACSVKAYSGETGTDSRCSCASYVSIAFAAYRCCVPLLHEARERKSASIQWSFLTNKFCALYGVGMIANCCSWCAGFLSFFCPCIQFGRNAEALGESCFMYALSQFVPLLNIYCRTTVRGRIRDKYQIDGSCFNDLLCSWCCAPCSLAQEGQVSDKATGTPNTFESSC